MVDINLLGEEEKIEEQQPEESFAQTVNLDLGETVEEEKTAPFPREPLGATYPRETMPGSYSRKPSMSAPPSSSRNKAYLLVAFLILAALVAVYLMIPRAGKKQLPVPVLTDTTETELPSAGGEFASGSQTEQPGTETPATGLGQPQPAQPEPTTAVEPMPSLSPVMRSMLASTRIGAYTVGALGQSFSGDNDFSLISFSGNNNTFLVQFWASSAAAVSEITQAMQRNASPEELRTVSKEGGSLNNLLVLGRVSERAGLMGPQGQRYMSFNEFSNWFKKLGSEQGLRLKLFDIGQAYVGEGGTHTPVQANFSGDKASVFEFLKSLADTGPNITLSKIIVSPADRRSLSTARLDLVLLFDFVE
ncbi:MAG: hypothetical protein ONB44_18375 [candidate division KSB1 bacterium]|nr:hypothetical protein [candidate division KSB1 bacterium]MDZ7304096.1 hypothetical protein [candidate division KSB1 bacterium]MDZ7312076.1 hypothetical protein [candidate division KSB1 bacterium]